jgi:hypothetical protein
MSPGFFSSTSEIVHGHWVTKMPGTDLTKNWHGKNTCSQFSGPQQDHWLRIGYQRMSPLIAHMSARPLSHARQVLVFQIRQKKANDEFISIWIITGLTIQGSHFNVSRTTSSKEWLIHHIPNILHQRTLIFSTLWSNVGQLARVDHSKRYKRMSTTFWALSGRMNRRPPCDPGWSVYVE